MLPRQLLTIVGRRKQPSLLTNYTTSNVLIQTLLISSFSKMACVSFPNYIIEHCSLELLPWNRNFHHPGKKEQWIPLVGFFKQVTQKSMLDTLIQAENSHKPHPHFNGFQKIQAATMKPLGLKQPLYADQVHQSRLTPTGVTNKMYLKRKLTLSTNANHYFQALFSNRPHLQTQQQIWHFQTAQPSNTWNFMMTSVCIAVKTESELHSSFHGDKMLTTIQVTNATPALLWSDPIR